MAAASSLRLIALAISFARARAVALARQGSEHVRGPPRGASRTPGAGMNPAAITQTESFMDGFYSVTCAKDYMHVHGDKFGDGKFAYELGAVSNVSIVHYTEVVPKEDQKPMTHEVCFSFCRTVKDMSFFGIIHGRDCYCTPYYDQIPGDSSDCDAVCQGDPTTMCGGMSKSSIFEMHSCDDSVAELKDASAVAAASRENLGGLVASVSTAGGIMQDAAALLQGSFGTVGDSAATTLLQAAKTFAGTLVHAAEDGQALAMSMDQLATLAAAPSTSDEASEKLTAEVSAASAKATALSEKLADLGKQASPALPEAGAAELYYSTMYFVDKAFVDVPSTCGGSLAAEPALATYGGCAAACEAAVGRCVGFGFFGTGGLCFLFSELSSITFYTGCGSGNGTAFLGGIGAARAAAAAGTKCAAKFAKFEGTTLKPDPSGKCTTCLKEAKKAARCFE